MQSWESNFRDRERGRKFRAYNYLMIVGLTTLVVFYGVDRGIVKPGGVGFEIDIPTRGLRFFLWRERERE